MKNQASPFQIVVLALLLLLATPIVMATPCIWRKKQVQKTEKEFINIRFKSWMFDYAEWDTNELIYLQSWMYVIPSLYEINDYDIQEWMMDISQGWLVVEVGVGPAIEASSRKS